MPSKRFIVLLLFFGLFSTNGISQKIIAFDKRGKTKRIRYFEGNTIKLKLLNKRKLHGNIFNITDSTFLVGVIEVHKDSVIKVYNTQKYLGFNIMHKVFIRAGLGYPTLVAANSLITNESPIVSESIIILSGTFLGVSFISKFISNWPYKISEKRPLKIIDISI